MQEPILHSLISVTETSVQDVYSANVDLTDMNGERYICDYISHPNDTFGLAPVVRQAIADWITAGNTPGSYVPPPITSFEVDVERDRRTKEEFKFNNVFYQLDDDSLRNIIAMGADAKFAVLTGVQAGNYRWADPNNDFGWIATDNTTTPMDALTMASFADAAKLWVSQHIFAARALKDADPVPTDYTDDSYWPSSE